MTTPTDPIPEFRLGADRHVRREPVAKAESEGHLDPETQEVVEAFEALYAELSSSAPDAAAPPAVERDPDDDLQIDLPDEFESAAPAPRAVETRAPQAARRWVQSAPAPARAQPGTGHVDTTINIDDAFAVLRAAESKGRATSERDAADAEEARETDMALPLVERSARKRDSKYAYDATLQPDWTGKARALWPKVAGAAAIALVVGTGVGYLVGRSPEPVASQAKIPVTPQGGAQLQFDYELGQK